VGQTAFFRFQTLNSKTSFKPIEFQLEIKILENALATNSSGSAINAFWIKKFELSAANLKYSI
jgi:hypothetical protein